MSVVSEIARVVRTTRARSRRWRNSGIGAVTVPRMIHAQGRPRRRARADRAAFAARCGKIFCAGKRAMYVSTPESSPLAVGAGGAIALHSRGRPLRARSMQVLTPSLLFSGRLQRRS
ncbi:hypothetical protein EVAR_53110_1 [Eumeta japonica]|uniref:Uncharacterized protein n=1 Tax=Eumeta variegata TaxID=151549 RepID=A0A4C1YAS9_EUMVA|nr:hypothetical protein EVAR_53110_1 [Eumeta japonica]